MSDDRVISEHLNIPVNPMQDFIDQVPLELIEIARVGNLEQAASFIVELHYPSVPEYSQVILDNFNMRRAAEAGVESIIRELNSCNRMSGQDIKIICAGLLTHVIHEQHIRECEAHRNIYFRELNWRTRNGLPTPYIITL